MSGIKGGGALEIYLGAKALEPFINKDLVLERFVPFQLPEVEGLKTAVKGLPAELFIEICQGFVAGLQASFDPKSPYPRLTDRQRQMAIQASMFLSACAKVGLEALIDEATGYQFERPDDALQVKLRAFIADELRAWEKTFPDELWAEFGRLTSWKGPPQLNWPTTENRPYLTNARRGDKHKGRTCIAIMERNAMSAATSGSLIFLALVFSSQVHADEIASLGSALGQCLKSQVAVLDDGSEGVGAAAVSILQKSCGSEQRALTSAIVGENCDTFECERSALDALNSALVNLTLKAVIEHRAGRAH